MTASRFPRIDHPAGLFTFHLISLLNPSYTAEAWPGVIVSMNHDLHLIHVVRGSVEFRLGDGQCVVGTPENVVAIPRFETYRCYRKADEAIEMINIHFEANWQNAPEQKGELRFPPAFQPAGLPRHHRRLRQCLRAWKSASPLRAADSRWQCALRLHQLVAAYGQSHGEIVPVVRVEPAMQAARIAIEQAAGSSFQSEVFARAAALSVPQFNRKFRSAYGLSPKHYWQRCRLRLARRLLEEHEISIKEAAEALGFSDPFYFSRWFRRMQGAPPSAYRSLEVSL